jgi:hypothetical protein
LRIKSQVDTKSRSQHPHLITLMEHAARARLYRQQADDCRKQAAAAVTPEAVREHWLNLARQYDDLAEQAQQLSTAKGQA